VVVPNLIRDEQWYESDEHDYFEIAWDCHSTIGPSLVSRKGGESFYYIDAIKTEKSEWLKHNREEKLKRLLK
jgi:hypothetical protein